MSKAEKLSKGWLNASMIIEVMGKPAQHIKAVLGMLAEKFAKEKQIEVLSDKVHEPKQVGNSEVFSAFVEIEFLVEKLSRLAEIIFDYMPSSIEISEPTNIPLKIEDANSFLNDLAIRLHQYDAMSKKLRLELNIAQKKLEELEKGK